MDTVISELRALALREMELDREREQLRKRRLEILELDQGARKAGRNMLTPENRKALFAGINVMEEDPKLLMWYDQAVTRMGGE